MLFILLSRIWFSLLIAVSALVVGGGAALPDPSPAEPVVTPGCRFSAAPPDDCAVLALLVPGVDPLAPF
jgi:hypothetical protein